MGNLLKIIGGVTLGLMALDVLGFTAWVLYGQIPADGFYLGAVTVKILHALYF